MQQPGLAGLGSGLPLLPSPAGPQAAEAVCDRQRAAGQRGQGQGDGSGHPQGYLHDPLGTGCRQDSLGLHRGGASATGPRLACTANQLLGFLKDCGDPITHLGHLGGNSSHGIILGQLRGQQRCDCTPGFPVGLTGSSLPSECCT